MANDNGEHWLEKLNSHLKELLDEAKRGNEIHRNEAKHYAYRERISRAKLKATKEKIEVLTKQDKKRRVEIPTKASFHASNTRSTIIPPIFTSFQQIFQVVNYCVFWGIFNTTKRSNM